MKLPKEIFEQHIAVLGKTGSGKTSTAKLFVEQAVADGARVCVLDPIKSDWWGLTSSADGKKAGLPFHILGGPHGHVPLHESAGKAIGEVVANGALPLSIIDMADFRMGGLQNFFCDFAESLLKKNRGHVYLVLEEAHEFAPKEMAGVKGENMGVYWAKKLATAGRSKGLRLVLLTQRTQSLHNALLGSCETMIVHRMTAPADQKPAIDWLKANASKDVAAEVAGSLSSLKTGEGWLCSGEAQLFERIKFPRISTFDNTSGQAHAKAVKTSPVDAEKLRSIIGAAVDEAKANDPAELKKQIADLKRQLPAKPAPAADPKAVERAVGAAVAERDKFWKPQLSESEKHRKTAVTKLERIHRESTLNGEASWEPSAPPVVNQIVNQTRTIPETRPQRIVPPAVADSGNLPKGETAILSALIQFPEGLQREQLTVLTTYKRSTRDRYLQYLQEKGLVSANGGTCVVTDAGREALPNAQPLPTGEELRAHWLTKLPLGERVILEALIERHPESVSREELSEITGYKRSTRDRYLQYMQLKMIVATDSTGVRASDNLF